MIPWMNSTKLPGRWGYPMPEHECSILRGTEWVPSPLWLIKKGDFFRMTGADDVYQANEDAVVDEDGVHIDADWHRKDPTEGVERNF